ncbi:TATA box-binding protein-associated factor RNA polymerase I subunit C, partial [Rhizophlyctis rosea]
MHLADEKNLDFHFQTDFAPECIWHPTTNPLKVTPREKAWDLAELQKSNETTMISYYEGNHYDAFVPRTLLREHIAESIESEQQNRQYDPFTGNLINVFESPSNTTPATLAYVGGEDNSSLNFTPISPGQNKGIDWIFEFAKSTTLNFKSSILDIQSSKAPQGSDITSLHAIRGHGFISVIGGSQTSPPLDSTEAATLDANDENHFDSIPSWEYHMIDSVQLRERPACMTFTPHLPGEAAVVTERGKVCLWDLKGGGERIRYHGGPETVVETEYSKRWRACQYAAHPRTLIVAQWDRV